MSRIWLAGALAAAFVLGGSKLVAADRDLFEGRPSFEEGRDLGYYVWVDGDTWHVRWTTTGKMRHFTGHVAAIGGDLRSLKRIDVEKERQVIRPGRAPRVVRGPGGRVQGVRGRVKSGRPPVVATREQDKIDMDGDRRIIFNARTDDDIDGFDFKVDRKVESLRFVLDIDGDSRPALVEAGRRNRHPAASPFVVNLR